MFAKEHGHDVFHGRYPTISFLQEEKYYRNGNGKKIGPMYKSDHDIGIWYSGNGGGDWYGDGSAIHGTSDGGMDLVSEWVDGDMESEPSKQVSYENQSESELIKMLGRDNAKMRKAGTKLSEVALYVIANHDGLHRLSLAVSEWARTLANEGDRDTTHSTTTNGS